MVDNRLAAGWPAAAAFAVAYAVLAAFSLATTQTDSGIAIIWPPSGVLVAGLLLLNTPARMTLLALVALASFAVNMAFGASLGQACGFTFANITEGLVAAFIACNGGRGCGQFDNPAWVLRYASGALAAAVASSVIASLSAGSFADLSFTGSWFLTVLLGMLIVGPIIITGIRVLAGQDVIEVSGARLVGLGLLAALSLAATFSQADYPLLFLPMVVTVLVTYVAGVGGALVMVLAISVAGGLSVVAGSGPVALIKNPTEEIYFFQFYLLAIFAVAMPLAALLARSRAQMAEISLHKAQHDAAQAFASVGHWRFCLDTNTSHWSDGMFHIYGLDPLTSAAMNLEHGSIIADDNAMVRAILERAVQNREPFALKARIQHATGEIRHIESTGDVELEGGRVTAIFGVLKDVTEHVAAMTELAKEKARAQALAKKAVLLSETDQLTEVANRRKLLSTLDREIARAERDGTELSVILIDVDHFKAINDTHGHATGDKVLREIARIGEQQLRKGDLFGRLGGEEFLAILPNTSGDFAAQIGERLRTQCSDKKWQLIEGLGSISVSLGVAVHQVGSDKTFLLQAADYALYQSKEKGRNRLTIAA